MLKSQRTPAASNEKEMPAFWVSGLDQSQLDRDGKVVDRWVRMGAAWPKKDSPGEYIIKINATPLTWNGTMLLQVPRADE